MVRERYDAVVFDFDGVLVESVDVKTDAFAALYRPYGSDIVEKVVAWHMAHGGVSRFEKFRHFHRVFLGRNLEAEEEELLGHRFSQLVEDAVVASAWVPGAREFLETHHSLLPLYIASGTPEDELIRIVGRRGMGHYFKGVYGSPTSKGIIIRNVIGMGGYVADRVLMVGDALTDLQGAQEAKVKFLARVRAGGIDLFPADTTRVEDLTSLARCLACD